MEFKSPYGEGSPYSEAPVRIHPVDEVKVIVLDDNNTIVHTCRMMGFNSVGEAVRTAFEEYARPTDIRDYTFRVNNITTGATGLYRLNAHDHLHLVV